MDKDTAALVEQYEKDKKKTMKLVLFIAMIVLGAALIVTALLFRTQYPFSLEDTVKYYIVYRNASIYYEQETDFATYSAHASKENVQPGITNHSVIQTSLERYTFLAKDGRTYCFEQPTGKLKALFTASYAQGKIYLRFAGYAAGIALIAAGAILIKKQRIHHEK